METEWDIEFDDDEKVEIDVIQDDDELFSPNISLLTESDSDFVKRIREKVKD